MNLDAVYLCKADVPGVMSADPRIVGEAAHIVPTLTYREARALAHSSARILHTHAIDPIEHISATLYCKNTNSFSKPGTMICNTRHKDAPMVQIVTGITTDTHVDDQVILVGDGITPEVQPRLTDLLSSILGTDSVQTFIGEAELRIINPTQGKSLNEVVRILHDSLEYINTGSL